MKINRIISAVNDNSIYLEFVPLVSAAWKKLSDITIDVAVVSNNSNTILNVGKHANVHHFPLAGIDSGVQSKISRMILACDDKFRDDICMLVDIDMIPLHRKVIDVFDFVPDDHFAKWGYDHPVYIGVNAGKWPMDRTTAMGSTFREIVNPRGLGYGDLIKSWYNFRGISKSAVNSAFKKFSDESLLASLYNMWGRKSDTSLLPRRLLEKSFMAGRIDRVSSDKPLDGVFECHGPRPFLKNINYYDFVFKLLGLEKHNFI